MSDDFRKADQIAHKLYCKLASVVNHARATLKPPPNAKVDKWFGLETPRTELFEEHTSMYRSLSSAPSVPGLRLQVLLCIPELATNQALFHVAPDSSRVRIASPASAGPRLKSIVLESWDVQFSPNYDGPQEDEAHTGVAPPAMYQHGVSLFRCIFTLLRVLPIGKLARRLRRRFGANANIPPGQFSIRVRVDSEDENIRPHEIMTFDTIPASASAVLKTQRQVLPPITHPMGELGVSVTYLTDPNFKLETSEEPLFRWSPPGASGYSPTVPSQLAPLRASRQQTSSPLEEFEQHDETTRKEASHDDKGDAFRDHLEWLAEMQARPRESGKTQPLRAPLKASEEMSGLVEALRNSPIRLSLLDNRAAGRRSPGLLRDPSATQHYGPYDNLDVVYASSDHGLKNLSPCLSECLSRRGGPISGTSMEDLKPRQGTYGIALEVATDPSMAPVNIPDALAQSNSASNRVLREGAVSRQWLDRLEEVRRQGTPGSTASADWTAGVGWGLPPQNS